MADKTISETVEKALILLSHLAEGGHDGLSLGDAAERAGISKPTAHRLLNTLVQQAFAERPPYSRNYRLGPAISALARVDIAADLHGERWRTCLSEISAETGAAAFLFVRAGDEALCVEANFGAFLLPTLSSGIGGRVPLGLGPGSMAILAGLGESEAEAILARNAPRLRLSATRTLETLYAQVKSARCNGYAFDPGEILAEVRGVAIGVVHHGNALPMAVTTASLASRLPEDRISETCGLMRKAVAQALGARS
ncbi:MAG: IclR family transcriptional regulator [Chelatococcus sp.]|jgi:DNA-binding IclR family transcriptional regulator|uniref:IclR family transcriptional regulator n=1 Tax=Chelatococcus sp. TaxID=1953771 RepID=UPI0025B9E6CD|nr:IclR family transcriptional regulator [Chelatococcus sp.]MBX3540534.1 IclR family transcriptional regulator [Chelatococcus sp.]